MSPIVGSVMKRFSDGNMSGPNKRFRGGPNDVEVRLLIPSKVAGSIIGKGGKNISKLRQEYTATITVPDCPGPERILTVYSSQLDTALKVIEEIVPNLEDFSGGRGGKSGEDVDLRMLVHQSQAGCIIGKGGGKVKELREKTGARIKIYTNCCPESTDRVVQITGRGNTCVNCVKEIIDLLKSEAGPRPHSMLMVNRGQEPAFLNTSSAPVKGIDNPYDPHNFDDIYAHEYGGYGSNGGGMGGSGGGGGRGMGPPPMGGPGRGLGGMRDGPRGMPMERGFSGGGGPGGPRGMGGPRGGGYGGGNGGGYGNNGMGPMGMNDGPMMGGPMGPRGMGMGNGGPPPPESTQVTIPKDLAGAIIGKAGARIRKIRSDSGAGITIDEPLPGSNDRIITITGNPSQIQMAQYLLQQSVHENTGLKSNRY